MCGEKSIKTRCSRKMLGSPPRVRGKAVVRPPLHANTWDHPRVCGEKVAITITNRSGWGSPPRVRGKADNGNGGQSKPGITPACAGKSLRRTRREGQKWDHPRVCGEKLSAKSTSPGLSGSPPRVRGKVPVKRNLSRLRRITPACAGKSESIRGELPDG